MRPNLTNMLITKRTSVAAILLVLPLIGHVRGQKPTQPSASADGWAKRLLTEKFADTMRLIKPQPGESRWMEIPWQTSLWTARQKAAAEGKPMFVWSGSGGAPCAPT